jgi:lipopolysaccharide/colanic/teichoic acid biosynthesis glycosyltransferase
VSKLKRAIDVAVSGVALVVLSPLFVVIGLAIILDSGFPVFYFQERVGRGFRRFRISKFRSMKADHSGSKITVGGDSRVTRIGKILRATKMDELPQFWNVVAGDMSLVGPRPEIPDYVEMCRPRYERILTVRPGITDLASVRFRDEERVLAEVANPMEHYAREILPRKLDLAEEYVRRHSLTLDASILLRTAVAVFRGARKTHRAQSARRRVR